MSLIIKTDHVFHLPELKKDLHFIVFIDIVMGFIKHSGCIYPINFLILLYLFMCMYACVHMHTSIRQSVVFLPRGSQVLNSGCQQTITKNDFGEEKVYFTL